MSGEIQDSARPLAEAVAKSGFLPDTIEPTDLTILNEALGSLFAKLHEASKLYRDKPDHGRSGTVVALKATMEFLLRFRATATGELYVPFAALASALVGLNDNNVAPVLRRVPRTGRAPDNEVRQVMVGLRLAPLNSSN
jgi:hypothetical protein